MFATVLLCNRLMLFKSALHIFGQSKYDYKRCQWIESLGAQPRATLSIILFADVWYLAVAPKCELFCPILWKLPTRDSIFSQQSMNSNEVIYPVHSDRASMLDFQYDNRSDHFSLHPSLRFSFTGSHRAGADPSWHRPRGRVNQGGSTITDRTNGIYLLSFIELFALCKICVRFRVLSSYISSNDNDSVIYYYS